jgi:lysophospholipid hydrolase
MCHSRLFLTNGFFSPLQEVGYNHGKTYFAGLLKAGLLPIFKPELGKTYHAHESSCYTFTDLAQMVCKVARNQYMDDSGEYWGI